MLNSPSTKFIYDIDIGNINNNNIDNDNTFVINMNNNDINNDRTKYNKNKNVFSLCVYDNICFVIDKIGLLYLLIICFVVILFYVLLFLFVMENIFSMYGMKSLWI